MVEYGQYIVEKFPLAYLYVLPSPSSRAPPSREADILMDCFQRNMSAGSKKAELDIRSKYAYTCIA